ncbi:MAG: elongation factor G [Armatimonadetes bacterium]|nr:elongation factor G [Armatimonadota bacterium]
MSSQQTENLRNVALIGHRGVGKTSLTEAMLHAAGAISQPGSVDQGTSVSDYGAEEKERNISISTSLCHCEHGGCKINLLDTPGYSEFYVDALYGLWVADTALLVLDAASGVEVHTIKMYEAARNANVGIIGVVNKLDGERADFNAAVAAMNETLAGCEAVPVQLPIGSGASFTGVVDLLSGKAWIDGAEAEVPAEMADEVEMARETLIDAVAATDDELTEQYLEEGTLSAEQLAGGLKTAIANGTLAPVLCTAATDGKGVTALLDFISSSAPSPAEVPAREAGVPASEETVELSADPAGPPVALVFKTISDEYVGQISLLRVISGTVKSDMDLYNPVSGQKERMSGLSTVQGAKTETVSELTAGDLGSVMRLQATGTGDTLCDQKNQLVVPRPQKPESMYAAAATAASRADADKLSDALARIAAEDMAFEYSRQAETGELLIKGMGPLHLDVVLAKLQRQFDVQVSLSEPKVPYRETVKGKARVQGRHKKQTGGRGQFGDVWIRIEPLPRGEGFEFVNEIKGGAVPTNYIPAVEKGIVEAMQKGPLAGYPVVDVRVTLDDGSSHPVDSSDMAFKMAGSIALRAAMAEAGAVLLEPIMNVSVAGPEDLMGDIMSDLNGKRGRILGTEQVGPLQVIKAQVPQAELGRYAADLRSISQGRASYEMEFSHYEEVPAHLAERVIAEAQAEKDEEDN